jgi:hypothetical protein
MQNQVIRKFDMDRIIRATLSPYLICIFIVNILISYTAFSVKSPYIVGDWLINYQGGFVRRGFWGELIFQLSFFTDTNPGTYVFVTQSFIYGIFLFFSFLLLKKENDIAAYALLIFSPFLFLFQINDPQGSFRKEILYFAILSINVWAATTQNMNVYRKIFYLTLFLYPLLILSHEQLAIYLPFIVAIYIFKADLKIKDYYIISILLLLSVSCFVMVCLNPGTIQQALAIQESLGVFAPPGGAISWLGYNWKDGFNNVSFAIANCDYTSKYFICIFLSVLAYLPIHKRLNIFLNIFFLSSLLISLAGLIPVFIVSVDWGRLIYIHLVTLFLMSFVGAKKSSKVNGAKQEEIPYPDGMKFLFRRPAVYFILILIYSISWHMPHYGNRSITGSTATNILPKVLKYTYICATADNPDACSSKVRDLKEAFEEKQTDLIYCR